MEKRLFTSESVTEGHPDKVCDCISDAILDELLKQDPLSRVACETCITTNFVLLMGEISTKAKVDYEKIVRETILNIGYDSADKGFDANTCEIKILFDEQSSDIAQGVDKSLEVRNDNDDEINMQTGAGDQGMMFGFATVETPELMPYPISMAHALTKRLTLVRKNGTLPYLRPDGKSQVTVEYDEEGKPVHINAIVVSTQHSEEVSQEKLHEDIRKEVIDAVIPSNMIDDRTIIYINPTGRFVIGGPNGDSGLTGRKIIVDTYGGYSRHGGGAFSGKDCTKVDRSACYAARYAAKNLVKAGIAKKCEIQLSYAIGVAEPTSINVETFGTGVVSNEKIVDALRKVFDFRPEGIIRMLDLRRPVYGKTAAYGHFGREEEGFSWEKPDRVEELKKVLSI